MGPCASTCLALLPRAIFGFWISGSSMITATTSKKSVNATCAVERNCDGISSDNHCKSCGGAGCKDPDASAQVVPAARSEDADDVLHDVGLAGFTGGEGLS